MLCLLLLLLLLWYWRLLWRLLLLLRHDRRNHAVSTACHVRGIRGSRVRRLLLLLNSRLDISVHSLVMRSVETHQVLLTSPVHRP